MRGNIPNVTHRIFKSVGHGYWRTSTKRIFLNFVLSFEEFNNSNETKKIIDMCLMEHQMETQKKLIEEKVAKTVLVQKKHTHPRTLLIVQN